MLQSMFEYWYLCKCSNSIYFLTFPLCSCYQVQQCGVEKRPACSGPSTKIISSKVGFVHCSCAPLCPWPGLGTPSPFPWSNLQLLRSVVILESFSVNRVILWQLLTGYDGKCGQMLACLLSRDAFAVTQKRLRRFAKVQVTWVCIKQLLNPLSNAIKPVMSCPCQDPDVSLWWILPFCHINGLQHWAEKWVKTPSTELHLHRD